MIVIKRDKTEVPYNKEKIINALMNANDEVADEDKITNKDIYNIEEAIRVSNIHKVKITVEEIQDQVEKALIERSKYVLSKTYILYRYNRELVRKQNTTDEGILSLVHTDNKDVMEENSNKNPYIASTQRDLIAGEVSKDITQRILLPKDIVDAHKLGILHFHDMDYFLQNIFNCCLINIQDMLDNGTVMNGKQIDPPHTFQVACTVTTQIIAAVASSQYGGQSVNIKHLAKYLKKSHDRYRIDVKNNLESIGIEPKEEDIESITRNNLKRELKNGVQTIQYQINTLLTTNGQSPFVTLFLHLDDNDPYLEYTAMIIEEILIQRLEGIKNEVGVFVTPAFPKLIYVLDENNLKGGKYNYITKLAAKCTAKRMYPDYISAKKMRENYDGEIFSPMGCRSFLSGWKDENGNYKWEGRFNQGVVSINLPQIGIIANGDEEVFWKLLDKRLDLCKKALLCRHKALLGTLSDISPIHWQHGAIARLKKGETIDKYLFGNYSSISLGYIGLYEMTYAMKGVSHTTKEGKEFALKVLTYLKEKVTEWKEETNIGFALYGTPAESLCYRFAKIDEERFGSIKNITDKGWYVNSYHVDPREKIDAFSKFLFESEFQTISSGGAISYVEIPNLQNNIEAIEKVQEFIYENIQYGEFNTKSDYCHNCGYDGEIIINDEGEWECPQCGNKDHKKMNVTRRT